jgi:hypothetical protein
VSGALRGLGRANLVRGARESCLGAEMGTRRDFEVGAAFGRACDALS